MSEKYLELLKNYMRDEKLCMELSAMAQRMFGVNFEPWVRKGYYEGKYIPYSFFQNGKIVANASANLMHFTLFGEEKCYVQIGTVMTEESYRNHGLARKLIEFIIEDYKEKADDIYLFGNDFAKEFYLKLGFKEGVQYQYYLDEWKSGTERTFVRANNTDAAMRKVYLEYIRMMKGCSAFTMKDYGLMTFWTAGMEHLYYSSKLSCYVWAEQKGDTLYLNTIVSPRSVRVLDVLQQMGTGFSKVVLGFTPSQEEMEVFQRRRYEPEDCHFLYLGQQLTCIENKKLFFPLYSHA